MDDCNLPSGLLARTTRSWPVSWLTESGNTILACPKEEAAIVHIHSLAPDVLKDEPIPPEQIVREEVIGKGGYGVVF